ncbi:MAG TPA: VCBS repeat-containing protein, partial [Fimbriimonadaceae bacterium]|nr:VCBS repeat-containing protein [Fimbriimonadaceae bacterium]
MLLAALLAFQTPTFTDRTAALGLTLGTDQACWVDVDNDGWVDLCASGALWRNNEGKGFTKMFEPGLVVAADFDNDGYPDLFSWSKMKLYHNDGGKRFTEAKLPDLPPTVSRGACWGDFDGDGYIDLYVGGYEDWDKDITYPSFLLMNQGGKSFKLASTSATFRTRGVTACDFNRDGSLDIYSSNYRLQPNQLLLNDGHGKFSDVATAYNA